MKAVLAIWAACAPAIVVIWCGWARTLHGLRWPVAAVRARYHRRRTARQFESLLSSHAVLRDFVAGPRPGTCALCRGTGVPGGCVVCDRDVPL